MQRFYFDVYGCSMARRDQVGAEFLTLDAAVSFANQETTRIARCLIDRSELLSVVVVVRDAGMKTLSTLSLFVRVT